MIFKDRKDAGRRLGWRLRDIEHAVDTVVVGLARGGVIVAREVAADLGLPLETIVVKKFGVPGNPNRTIGAVADGIRFLDREMIEAYRVPEDHVDFEIVKAEEEIARRIGEYRRGRPLLDFGGKTVVIVDDGIATGATMIAAVSYAKTMDAREVIVAAPVASDEALWKIGQEVDRTVCLEKVGPYFSEVAAHYEHFPQVSDSEVIKALRHVQKKEERKQVEAPLSA